MLEANGPSLFPEEGRKQKYVLKTFLSILLFILMIKRREQGVGR